MQDNEKNPALRFKGFTDPWEQRKLGEIAKEVVRNDPASDAPIMMITTPSRIFLYIFLCIFLCSSISCAALTCLSALDSFGGYS